MLREPQIYQAKEESENIFGNKSYSWELKESWLYKYIEEKEREGEREGKEGLWIINND